jgi:hypothetical protein
LDIGEATFLNNTPAIRHLVKFGAAVSVLTLGWLSLPAPGQVAVKNQGYVPFSEEPINYRSDNLTDPVAKLQKQLDRGETKLEYEPQHGYLKSVLEKLKVPVDSQALVFSKTSFQYKKISPEHPRALYYNDDVYVGQVHEGKVLEFVSFDPVQGAIFYILDEQKAEHPVFQRAELDCTQCHVAAGTRNVPGVLLRSIFTNPSGTQALRTDAFITGQESPLNERWGGWYVTGTTGDRTHMGNVVVADKEHPEQLDRAAGANVTDLSGRIDTSAYLRPDSDIVAQLVLAHQTQMHNLITLTNYQTRLALYAEKNRNQAAGLPDSTPLSDAARKQYEKPAEELVRYLLFANEAPLAAPVKGTSGFTDEFAARGPRDPQGRSLRDFDLRTRIFKYPCSYLIYSEAFDALPGPAKEYVYQRLLEILTGREQSPDFAKLTSEDRRSILEILLATKPGLPAEWNAAGLFNRTTRTLTEKSERKD